MFYLQEEGETPEVPLPELLEVRSGEEDEVVLFPEREVLDRSV